MKIHLQYSEHNSYNLQRNLLITNKSKMEKEKSGFNHYLYIICVNNNVKYFSYQLLYIISKLCCNKKSHLAYYLT